MAAGVHEQQQVTQHSIICKSTGVMTPPGDAGINTPGMVDHTWRVDNSISSWVRHRLQLSSPVKADTHNKKSSTEANFVCSSVLLCLLRVSA